MIRIEGAAPSFCMHNSKAAGKPHKRKRSLELRLKSRSTFRGFEALPRRIPNHSSSKFYGFVFQDSDFYKWIEAVRVIPSTQHPDPPVEAIADGAIDIVCAAQQEDGYLPSYYILNGKDQRQNLRDHHELYCLGHLLEGAVAYYQATGKNKLLKAASRYAGTRRRLLRTERENARAIRAMKSQKWHSFSSFMKRLRIPNI